MSATTLSPAARVTPTVVRRETQTNPILATLLAQLDAGDDYRLIAGVLADSLRDDGDDESADLWGAVYRGEQHIERAADGKIVITAGWGAS